MAESQPLAEGRAARPIIRKHRSTPITEAEKASIPTDKSWATIEDRYEMLVKPKRRSSRRIEERSSTTTCPGLTEPPCPKRQKSLTATERTARATELAGGKSLKTIAQGPGRSSGYPHPCVPACATPAEETYEALLDERDPFTRQTDGFMHKKVPRDGASKSFSQGYRPGPGSVHRSAN